MRIGADLLPALLAQHFIKQPLAHRQIEIHRAGAEIPPRNRKPLGVSQLKALHHLFHIAHMGKPFCAGPQRFQHGFRQCVVLRQRLNPLRNVDINLPQWEFVQHRTHQAVQILFFQMLYIHQQHGHGIFLLQLRPEAARFPC